MPEAGGDDKIQVGIRQYKGEKVNSGVHHDDCGNDFIDANICHGLSRWLSGKESACQCRRLRFNLWIGKILWRRKWQPPPVFLPGKFHGQRSLADYSPWGDMKSDKINN